MPRKIDLSTVPPELAAELLRQRESKRRSYLARREELLARAKAWQEVNKEKVRASGKAWREANTERKAASRRDWYERNRELVLARQAERDRNLADPCVKARFVRHTGLQNKDIPDELVPIIRQSMLIKREIRQLKKAQKS